MIPVRFHREAEFELLESAGYYEDRQTGLGKRFSEAVENSIGRIRSAPARYRQIEPGIRCCRVNRFPYGIVFRERGGDIEILAVLHFKRNPDYWKNRV